MPYIWLAVKLVAALIDCMTPTEVVPLSDKHCPVEVSHELPLAQSLSDAQ